MEIKNISSTSFDSSSEAIIILHFVLEEGELILFLEEINKYMLITLEDGSMRLNGLTSIVFQEVV